MKKRYPYVGAVFGMVERLDDDGNIEVLLLRRFNTGRRDGYYSLPAGHMDGNEIPREAMVRELKEEIGIDVELDDLKFVGSQYTRSNDERLNFYFSVRKRSGEIINNEPNKCDDLLWCSPSNLPKKMDYCGQVIEHYQSGRNYFEIIL